MFVVNNPYLQLDTSSAVNDNDATENRLVDILDKVRKDNPDLNGEKPKDPDQGGEGD